MGVDAYDLSSSAVLAATRVSQAEMEALIESTCHRTLEQSEERELPIPLRSPTAWQVALAKGELGSPAIDPVRSPSKGSANADPHRHVAGEIISVTLLAVIR